MFLVWVKLVLNLDVRKSMLNIMSSLKKRIIVASFASNVAVWKQFFIVQKKLVDKYH